MAAIPVVDFSSLSLSISDDAKLNECDVKRTAEQLMNAFTTGGAVYLSNTGFSQDLVPVASLGGGEGGSPGVIPTLVMPLSGTSLNMC